MNVLVRPSAALTASEVLTTAVVGFAFGWLLAKFIGSGEVECAPHATCAKGKVLDTVGLDGLEGLRHGYRIFGRISPQKARKYGVAPGPIVLNTRNGEGMRHPQQKHGKEVLEQFHRQLDYCLIRDVVEGYEEVREGKKVPYCWSKGWTLKSMECWLSRKATPPTQEALWRGASVLCLLRQNSPRSNDSFQSVNKLTERHVAQRLAIGVQL